MVFKVGAVVPLGFCYDSLHILDDCRLVRVRVGVSAGVGVRGLGVGLGFGGQGWGLAFVVGAPATVSPGRSEVKAPLS